MDPKLLTSLGADAAVAVAFCALMVSLAAVSRHPAMRGAVQYAFGHLFFTLGSGLYILFLDAGVPTDARPLFAAFGLAASSFGAAAMVAGMAQLLEVRGRSRWIGGSWAMAAVLLAVGLTAPDFARSTKIASDLANTFAVAAMAVVLFRRHDPPYRLPALSAGVCAAVLVPLYLGGSIQEWTGHRRFFVPAYAQWVWLDLALWNTINLCAMMLASFRALVVFVRRSRTDPLTHCLNRSGFEDELHVRTVRVAAGTPVTVLALDIDYFKAINDRFGHSAGDAYLVAFAEAIQSCVRQTDLVARTGGEEFLAVLIDAEPEIGERVAEEILRRIRQMVVDCDGEPIRTTVSIGLANGFGLASVHALIRRADRALYAAKSGGRDRASTAGVGETTGNLQATT